MSTNVLLILTIANNNIKKVHTIDNYNIYTGLMVML